MGLRGRFSIPEAWLLLVVGMCILAAVAADVGYVIVRRHRTSSARAANAQYPLPEVTGVLRLHDPMYGVRSVATVGGPCKGLGGYHDFIGGTPVSVKDRAGAVIATGALNPGKVVDGAECEFAFVVQAVPNADQYQFDVGGRAAGTYRYDDVAAQGWQVALSLG